MNKQRFIQFILAAAVAALIPATVWADDDDATNFNHVRLSARAGFNITGRFKNLGTLTLPPSARTTPDGTPYNYDNGYVLTDISGNAGGQTWNWGYDGPGQISGNSILMSRTAPGADTESPSGLGSGHPNLGFELTYDRELGTAGKWRYGVEGAVNYTRVSFNDSSSFMGNLVQTVDAYGFTPGTTPPATPPAYQGTFNGPGFLLNSTPSSSTSTVVGNTLVTGQRQFSSDIWGTRVGPYVEYPLAKNLDISLSAGLAAGLLFNSASWNETISVAGVPSATSVGSGHSTGFVWGGYASANVDWQFYKRWSVEGGVQFQDLGTYSHDVGSRAVELDLSKSIFVTVGVGCKF